MNDLRIDFLEAMHEKLLFKKRWETLSLQQQTMLKVVYGYELDEKTQDEDGFTEMDYWRMGEGQAEYDDLGFVVGVDKTSLVYAPQKYTEAWLILGRRGGKTSKLASTIIAYEATCGGHEAYIESGQEAVCFLIAQDMRFARNSLGFIRPLLEDSPALGKLIKNSTVETIELKNGITIAVMPPSLRSTRGYANPCAIFDEVGVWYQDAESANPDYEIYRAVKPAQAQFPDAITVAISSPYNKQGLLHAYYEAKTNGRGALLSERKRYTDCVVLHAPTASMGNPHISKRWLRVERDRDPKAFERECLAVFQDSISGFLSPTLLREVVEVGVTERSPVAGNYYVAAMDPAFRRDAFGFCICHAERERGVVFDLLRRWEADGTYPLNPSEILDEIGRLCRQYHVVSVYTDQYHLESLQQLALQKGFGLEGVTFTSQSKNAIYGSFQQLLNQRKVRLLDEAVSLRELRSIERTLTGGGSMQIQAPRGMHDDMSTVIVLAAERCLWMLPDEKKKEEEEKERTPYQRAMASIKAHKNVASEEVWD